MSKVTTTQLMRRTKELRRIVLGDVSGEELWKHIEYFSKIVRVSGTQGEREALEYICENLRSYGIDPEVYEFDSYVSIPVTAELMILSPVTKAIQAITHSFAAPTSADGIEGHLVFVESEGRTEDPLLASINAEPYSKLDVEGKMTLVEGIASPTKLFAAEDAHAAAQIHISSEPMPHEMIVTTIWGTPTPSSAGRIPRIPAASVGEQDGRFLQDLCRKGTVRIRLKTIVDTGWRKLALPVATIRGRDGAGHFVLIGGHYDSWHVGVTDNATGDATLLEIARVMQKHRKALHRSVKVAWWPGHSVGRFSGSTWFADNLFDDLNKHAVAYVNIDSPGCKGNTMYDLEVMAEASALTTRVVKEVTHAKFKLSRPGRWGDMSFWGLGFPSIECMSMAQPDNRANVGGSGGGWWWHTPEDTLDKADYDVEVRDTKLNLAIVLAICNAHIIPWNFGELAEQYIRNLNELQSSAHGHFDFEQLTAKARQLKTQGSRLRRAALSSETEEGKAAEKKVAQINETYLRLSRVLIPALFTRTGRYDQDPAIQGPLLPSLRDVAKLASGKLTADERGFLLTHLVRERNRTSDALNQALLLVRDCLAEIKC